MSESEDIKTGNKFMNAVSEFSRRMLSRASLTFAGERDLFEVLGYSPEITSAQYRTRYERGDIAQAIVNAYPSASWSSPPVPDDDIESEDDTPWQISMQGIAKELKLWSVIRKADVLCQLNDYSVILFGLEGTTNTSDPIEGKPKIIYLKAYGSDCAEVVKYETNPSDPRFGMPLIYKITTRAAGGANEQTTTIEVHYSRLIHIAERTLDDDFRGIPYLKPVWNVLDDLDKVRGGSGEVFWLNARAGLNLNAESGVDLPDKTSMKDSVDAYQHNLSRVLYTQGIDVKPLSQAVASPKDAADLYFTIISATTRIPRRILEGSERGQLASAQDENNFTNQIEARRLDFCEPVILDPLIEMLVALGRIKAAEYVWEWPALSTVSKVDQSTIAMNQSKAIADFTNAPASNSVMPDKQFVEDVLGMEYRESDVDLEAEGIEIEESKASIPTNED
jgi:hypothetical protein